MVMHVVQWLRRSPKNWCEGNHQEHDGEREINWYLPSCDVRGTTSDISGRQMVAISGIIARQRMRSRVVPLKLAVIKKFSGCGIFKSSRISEGGKPGPLSALTEAARRIFRTLLFDWNSTTLEINNA
jgi:hypothetical protein